MKNSLFVALALLLFSCQKNVYKKLDTDFNENRWEKTDVRNFEFSVADNNSNYDLILLFSHGYDFGLSEIPVRIEIRNSDNTVSTEDLIVKISDTSGKRFGDCSGDYCDLKQAVFENRKLAAGNYKVAVINEFDHSFLPNVLGVGIELNLSKSN